MDIEKGYVTIKCTDEVHSFESIDMLIDVLKDLDDNFNHSGSISIQKCVADNSESSVIHFGNVSKDYLLDFIYSVRDSKQGDNYIV